MPNRHRNFRKLKADDIIKRLEHEGIRNSRQEALWITAHALGVSHAEFYTRPEFTADEERKINALISRRVIDREPLQYILGEADFYGRDFHVGRGVLIPRADTETLIEGVKKCFNADDEFRFLDWGTGSGCIAITILLEFPKSSAYMLDISNEALSYARENLRRYGLNGRAETGREVSGEFDLIVSNPPYIPTGEIEGLMSEVRDYEPHTALDGGIDGMKYYREIFALAVKHLKNDGYIIFETGSMNQVKALEDYSGDFETVGVIIANSIIMKNNHNV